MNANYKTSIEFWKDFLENLSEIHGIFLQLIGKNGVSYSKPFNQRTICSYLKRFNKTVDECSKSCHDLILKCIEEREVKRISCYMGVEYFAVPVLLDNGEIAAVVGGKVLTTIPYRESYTELCERYGLDLEEVLNSINELKFMKDSAIDSYIKMIEKFGNSSASAFSDLRELKRSEYVFKKSFDAMEEICSSIDSLEKFYFAILNFITTNFNIKDASLLVINENRYETVADIRDFKSKGIFSQVSISSTSQLINQLKNKETGYLVVTDTSKLEEFGIKWGTQSLSIFPVITGIGMWGMILVFDFISNNEQMDDISKFCLNLKQGIEKFLIKEKIESIGQQKVVFKKIVEDLKKYNDVNELLITVANKIGWYFNAQRVSIAIVDEEAGRLELKAVRGIDKNIINNVKYLSENSISNHVFKSGTSIFVRDIMSDEKFSKMAHLGCNGRAFASVPLRNNGTSLGVVNLSDITDQSNLDEEYFEALEDLIKVAALIIERAICKRELGSINLKYVDETLGIYNKKYFAEYAKNTIENSKRYNRNISIVLLDFGEENGVNEINIEDKMRTTVNEAKKLIRRSDIMAAYDKNKFAFLLPDTEKDGALIFARKIQAKVQDLILLSGKIGEIKVKVGVSTFPNDGGTLGELTFIAKNALGVSDNPSSILIE